MSSMREPTFLILTALAAQSRHGYGIITDVTQLSGGRVKLAPGTSMVVKLPPTSRKP